MTLFHLPYFGSVWHWQQLLGCNDVVFEAHGSFQRRTFRNRTTIATAAGPLALSVPVQDAGNDAPYRDIRINYETPWARQHLHAFLAAYNSSPLYEYFVDDLEKLYAKRHEFLWDLNLDAMALIEELMNVRVSYALTDDFIRPAEVAQPDRDLRKAIEPKHHAMLKTTDRTYYQVFKDRVGFQDGVSILDLLFNEGPYAVGIIKQ